MPFYMAKRSQDPEPKEGQIEWDIFKEMYGKSWDEYDHVKVDPETKITIFDYEKYIHKDLLKDMDTNS